MIEDDKLVSVETPEPVVPDVVPEIQRSDEEVEAMSKGWNPDYDGDGKVDAGEFLRREPLFGKIAEVNRRIRDQEKLLKDVMERNRVLAERDRQKELNDLAAKRREAVSIGDEEGFDKFDKEYAAKEAEPVLPATPAAPREYTPTEKKSFEEFKARNASWIEGKTQESQRMLRAADEIYSVLEEEIPGKSVAEYLRLTEEKVKTVFSHRFKNEARTQPQSVSTPGRVARKVSDLPSRSDLNDVQKHQCDLFVKNGGKTEEYIQQLRDLGRI